LSEDEEKGGQAFIWTMLLLTCIEFVFLALDYFGLLFVPIYERVEDFRRQLYHWLAALFASHHHDHKGAGSFSRKVAPLWAQIVELERRRTSELSSTKSKGKYSRVILPTCFYPTTGKPNEGEKLELLSASGVQVHWLAADDCVATQLNWLHFDFCCLADKVEPHLGRHIKGPECEPNRKKIPGSEQRAPVANGGDKNEPVSVPLLEQAAEKAKRGPARRQRSCWQMISSANDPKKWLLVSKCGRCTGQATSNANEACFFLANLMPADQRGRSTNEQLNKRSSLIFNQLQKHGELFSGLFLLLSLLLERARLLQAGPAQLIVPATSGADSSQLQASREIDGQLGVEKGGRKGQKSSRSAGQQRGAEVELWLELVGREFVGGESADRLLDRYALALVICAYLDSVSAGQIGQLEISAEDKRTQLEHHFEAFVGTFGWKEGKQKEDESHCDGAKLHEISVHREPMGWRFELVTRECKGLPEEKQLQQQQQLQQGQRPASRLPQIRLADPLPLGHEGASIGRIDFGDRLQRVWPEVCKLLGELEKVAQLHWRREKACLRGQDKARGDHTQSGGQEEEEESLLAKLVAKAEEHGRLSVTGASKQAERRRLEFMSQVQRLEVEATTSAARGCTREAEWPEEEKVEKEEGEQELGQGSAGSRHRWRALMAAWRWTPAARWLRVVLQRNVWPSRGHLGRQLLFLFLFLLLRNVVINYLEGWQEDMRDQSREELVKLKQIMFAGVDFDQLMFGPQKESSRPNKQVGDQPGRPKTSYASTSADTEPDHVLGEEGAPLYDAESTASSKQRRRTTNGHPEEEDEDEDEDQEEDQDGAPLAEGEEAMLQTLLSVVLSRALAGGSLGKADLEEMMRESGLDPSTAGLVSQIISQVAPNEMGQQVEGDAPFWTNIGAQSERHGDTLTPEGQDTGGESEGGEKEGAESQDAGQNGEL